MSKLINLIGKRFGKWAVLSKCENTNSRIVWMCRCDCGVISNVLGGNLRDGHSTSCGCTRAVNPLNCKALGLSQSGAGKTFYSMMSRCFKPESKDYQNYGGRGITVCEFLKKGPQSLVQIIGERPTGKTIDRIDVNKNYSCGDCGECASHGWSMNIRWTTPSEQQRNTRVSIKIEIDGVTRPPMEWASLSGLSTTGIVRRFHKGLRGKELLKPAFT